MKDSLIEVHAERSFYKNSIELAVMRRRADGRLDVGLPITLAPIDADSCITQPTLSLQMAEAQLFIDELWRCGLRPTEGTGSAGSLAATERHLKDMREMAMGLLRKSGVKV